MDFLASDIAQVVGGTLRGDDRSLSGASIDSRSIEPDQLFVPIVAERDGHDYIDSAVERGAAAYFTSRQDAAVAGGATAIVVGDTMDALTRLGQAARARLDGPVVGITGSVGKTSVKDLTAAALRPSRTVHASQKSFNNEMGVPLTLINADASVEVAVIEMGARGVGHIEHLCSITKPTIGVVTMVGAVHTSEFGDVATVAQAKGELVESLPTDGHAILNIGCEPVAAMATRTSAQVLTYGDAGDVRAEQVVLDDQLRPSFRAVTPMGSCDVCLAVRGAHQVENALAALAVGTAVGADLASLAEGLSTAALSPWRMEVHHTESGAVIINDAYNANTLSVTAALDALRTTGASNLTAVLGVMAELGDRHDADHAAMGEYARANGIRVIAFQEPAYGADVVATIDDALAALGPLDASHAVLVKGSRVAELERLADRLR